MGRPLVQSVDYLPALVGDPFVFGRIAALHGFSDLFAMGADPHSALAAAVVPFGTTAATEELLFQMLAGVATELRPMGALLLGGHSAEGAAPALALTCNGLADPDLLLRKDGLLPGQSLILTKPLGIGTLFAAEMRLAAQGRWIDAAVASMLASNRTAAAAFLEHGATGCTDITGFGLLGHLVEMLHASGLGARLDLDSLPILDGAADCSRRGFASSLAPANSRSLAAAVNARTFAHHPHLPLLLDPQTSGGLLAGVPADRTNACLDALARAGIHAATVIATTTEAPDAGTRVVLLGNRGRPSRPPPDPAPPNSGIIHPPVGR
jgi:selenide,water dikinase